jgi:DNA/RNA-binding domain of Phe-tRNA-synthetase-like protein
MRSESDHEASLPQHTSGMTRFRYDPELIERFPAVVGGVLLADGLTAGATAPELAQAFAAGQKAVLRRLSETALSEVPSLFAWRRAFRAFGVDPTAYRSAAEALLRRLTKQGSIPSINTLVDIGNLVSIRYALPVAMFDARSITGTLTVRPATGAESFMDLGSGTTEQPEPGEVIFIDEAGHVAARRWCWRQSAESASSASTTDVLVTVEGHHPDARRDVEAALADLDNLLRSFAGATETTIGVVDARSPAFP